jgi:glyoxylase-like metal-dependent hydrolase (beta-lactamase superfamily II)
MSLQIVPLTCGDIEENAWLVSREDREDCVLIDPGDDIEKLKKAVQGRKLAAILLTHGHFDHILGAQPLSEATGAPIWASETELGMLNDPWMNGLQPLLGLNGPPEPLIRAAAFGERFEAAGLTFQILPTPGHTKGSVCLYLPDESTLFSGDTLFRAGFGRMDLPGGSPMDMRHSLRRLFELPEDTRVHCGHGEDTTIGEEKRRFHL